MNIKYFPFVIYIPIYLLILLSCQATFEFKYSDTTSTSDDQSLSIDTSFITKNLVATYPFNKVC